MIAVCAQGTRHTSRRRGSVPSVVRVKHETCSMVSARFNGRAATGATGMPVRRLPKGVRNADRALDAGSAATRAAARGAAASAPRSENGRIVRGSRVGRNSPTSGCHAWRGRDTRSHLINGANERSRESVLGSPRGEAPRIKLALIAGFVDAVLLHEPAERAPLSPSQAGRGGHMSARLRPRSSHILRLERREGAGAADSARKWCPKGLRRCACPPVCQPPAVDPAVGTARTMNRCGAAPTW